MTDTAVRDPATADTRGVADEPGAPLPADAAPVDPRVPLAPPRVEHDLVWGRPLEDRGFETVEAGAGFAVGLAFGAMVGGPIGAAVGGVAGAAGGFMVGEALERKMGRPATTTDATEDEAQA